MTAFIEDRSAFFNASEFAVTLTRADGNTITGILDRPWAEVMGMIGQRITVTAPGEVIGSLTVGEVLNLEGERLEVVAVHKGTGIWTAELATKGYEAIIRAGSGRLDFGYIDEEYPSFPVLEPLPPTYDPGVLVLRAGEFDAHLVVRIGALSPALIPPGSIIDRAELWLYAIDASSSPTWTMHRVLQPMSVPQTNWLQYRSRSLWTGPGCTDEGADYEAAELAGDDGFVAEWTNLLSGSSLVRLVQTYLSVGVGFILLPTGGPGEARFCSGDETVPESNRPFLRVVWRKARC